MGTLIEIVRWIGIGQERARKRVRERWRRLVARLLGRDVVVAGSERKFRALLESAPDAMVIVDDHGHIQLVNAQAERTFGYARGELIGQHLSCLIPERHRNQHHVNVRAYLGDARPRVMGGGGEMFARRKDGTEFPAEISLGPLETDQGLLVSSVIRDVTDRKRAEAALRRAQADAEAEQQFRTAFEEAPVGIALTALDGRLVKVNRALCEITGHTREHLEASTIAVLLHPDDRPGAAADLLRMTSGEARRSRAERRYLTASGEAIPVDVSVAVVLDPDGRPLHLLAQINDISERKRAEDKLQYLADHDVLTGLVNRRRFERDLERAIAAGSTGAVLAIDLDHFKFVNDTLGHSAGDDLLVRVATVFRERLRATDTLARLGGDEFAVLLPDADMAPLIAAKLLAALNDETQEADAGSPTRWVTASIGIATLGPTSPSSEEVLVQADIAMYDAKEAGRNRCAVYDASSDRLGQMQDRLDWSERIRSALANDRFVLHAQPIVSLSGDPVPRHELLIRMQGDDGELIAPGAFLEVAERVELVQQIDRWVFSRAIALLAAYKRAGRKIVLALNLSARTMVDPEMTAFIAAELARAGIDGTGLCIELTETAAVGNVSRAQRFAEELSALGCELALDDFGAGFASFYYLKHMEFDVLKIDGEFIRGLPESRVNQLVVQAVVGIAAGLGKRTVAEFVGDAETLMLLRGYGVDFAQGYYLAMPQPLDALDLAVAPAMPRAA